MEGSPPAPAPASPRVLGFDLARAFAIATMVLINFQVYLLRAPSGEPGEIWWRWLAHAPSGRSSATFVILAGAGVAQMSRRARETGEASAWWAVRRTLFLRTLFLFVAGNLLILVWSIDILHFYAFYVLFAALFVRASGRVLLGTAALVVALTTAGAALFPWVEELDLPYRSPLGMAANVAVNGIHPLLPWLAFVFYGMWLGRQDLVERARRRRVLLAAAASAVAIELVASLLATLAVRGLLPIPAEAAALLGTSWSPEPLYVLGACSTSTFVVALAHEIVARWPADRVVRALVRTGQLSLSIYLLHALVGVGIPRWVFHWENGLTIELVVAYWAVFVTLVVLAANVYRWLLPRGPVEAVMRWLTGSGEPDRGVPVLRAAADALGWLRAPRVGGWRADLEGLIEDGGARFLERVRDEWRAAWARGRAPSEAPALAPAAPARPGARIVALLTLCGALVVLGSRIVGTSPPTFVCPPPAPLTLGSAVTSQLTMLCPHAHFALALDARSGLELETRSGTDVLVEVRREDGELVASDDDSGPGLDAYVRTALPPGRYDVLVRPYSATSGPFVISARAADASSGAPRPAALGLEPSPRAARAAPLPAPAADAGSTAP